MTARVATIDRELGDYRQVAHELHVGVNHAALDEERTRQEQFLNGIVDLQGRISRDPQIQEMYGDEVESLKNGIRLNADVLTYLKSITKLEGPLTEITNKITQTAVSASSPTAASSEVYANKALTENVNNCWEYIAQLSAIVQSHLKDAAAYQQYHHMANEVDAHIQKMVGLAEMKMFLFDPQGTVDEAAMLAKELEDDHVELARTWEMTHQLTEMARHLKPVQNRISRVVSGRTVDTPSSIAQQVVMVKALINHSGSDFAIRKGEEMILMNNDNPNFWRVKTAFGEREVPSVIFTTIGPNQEDVFKANSLQKRCVADWKRVLERTKGKLVKYYITLFERYCQDDAVYFAHEDEMNAFLDDLDSLLIAPNYDSGMLHRAYDKFTNTLMLLSPNRRPPRGAEALSESDIRTLHLPLRRVLNQVTHLDQIQAKVSMTGDEVQRYLKSVESERQHIMNEITRMEEMQREKEGQLQSLAGHVNKWKTKRKAFDRAISDYTSDDLLKHFPATRLTKPRVIENDYRMGDGNNHYESDHYESSGPSRINDSSTSEYGHVAKQMVTPHKGKETGVKFAGGVTQDMSGGRIWAGNTQLLKRSASTNDLQTQILQVKMNTGTQYELDEEVHDVPAMKGTSDVQAQIIRVTKSASSQVGVRVMPKAIDLSAVEMSNLGVEVAGSEEASDLGLRVGQVLYPVTVGTTVDLYEGPGVQVMGINDVESLSLQMGGSTAKATKDGTKRLKVRDVQSQIISKSDASSIRDDLLSRRRGRDTPSSEVQTQINVLSKTAEIQAVAAMEVVNISSKAHKPKVVDGTATTFCILPERDPMLSMRETPTSDVMTQISCLLHSRGISSDLETYLNEYRKRHSDFDGTRGSLQSYNTETMISTRTGETGAQKSIRSSDVETLISKVVCDAKTQVSSRLVPMEVTVSKLKTENMSVAMTNPLINAEFNVPADSLICPVDMKFQTELYDGSDIEIVDYNGLGNILVTQADKSSSATITPVESSDSQTQIISGLSTQAAVVLKAKGGNVMLTNEVVATSKPGPKLKIVVTDIAAPKTNTSDLQTQISDTRAARTPIADPVKIAETSTNYSLKRPIQEATYSTTMNDEDSEDVRVIGNVVCLKCKQKYREIQLQFDPNMAPLRIAQTEAESQVESTELTQVEKSNFDFRASPVSGSPSEAATQVALELVPTDIEMTQRDVNNLYIEFDKNQVGKANSAKITSVSCPAKMKVKGRLVEGSGVHIIGMDKARQIGMTVNTTPVNRKEGTVICGGALANDACGEFETQVDFEELSSDVLLSQQQCRSTQRSGVRLVPAGVNTSDSVSQILTITAEASTQVGAQLVPQAIGISPVNMEGMEVVASGSRADRGEESLSVTTLLYPAQVELETRLAEEKGGIEVMPLEHVDIIGMTSPDSTAQSDGAIRTGSGRLIGAASHLLPASVVLETGQFDGRQRSPRIATQSIVCGIKSRPMAHQQLTIRPKTSSMYNSEFSGDSSNMTIGVVSNEAVTQTQPNAREESYIPVRSPSYEPDRESISCQVGARLTPRALKVAQIPVKNLKLESSASSPSRRQSLTLQSIRYPAEIRVDCELCEDSGIVVCSLDQSGEIEVKMSDSEAPSMTTGEYSSGRNAITGWWSSITSGKSPLFETKSMQNAVIKLPKDGESGTAEFSGSNLVFQAEALLKPDSESSSSNLVRGIHSNSKLKLVLVDGNVSSVPGSALGTYSTSTTTNRDASAVSFSPATSRVDHGVQVGVKLIPNSVEVKSVKLENMEVVVSRRSSMTPTQVDARALLCTSAIKYHEELSEASGIHVIQIETGDDISLEYNPDKLVTNVVEGGWKGRAVQTVDRSRQPAGVGIIASVSQSSVNYSECSGDSSDSSMDGRFVATTLRIRDVQSTSRRGEMSSTEVSARTPRRETAEKDIQVGLNLIPKAVTVERIKMENLDIVQQRGDLGVSQQSSFGALMYSKPTEYTEVLTESRGVTVLPLESTDQMEIGHEGDIYYATVNRSRSPMHEEFFDGKPSKRAETSISNVHLRVHHAEFSAHSSFRNNGSISLQSRPRLVDSTTQVGAVFVPMELKMEAVSLDSQQVSSASKPQVVDTVLCPTEMDVAPVLTECPGVRIAPVSGTAEISIQMDHQQFVAEVVNDAITNRPLITLKEASVTNTRQLITGSISLVQPTATVNTSESVGRLRSAETHSKGVQVGALLIPTNVVAERVKVDNLEFSVPLDSMQTAEVDVSAVLASSATEMTSVLANTSGIHIVGVSEVNEIGVSLEGMSVVGRTESSTRGPSRVGGDFEGPNYLIGSVSTTAPERQTLVAPIGPVSETRKISGTAESVLRQSPGLSQLHDKLQQTRGQLTLGSVASISSTRTGVVHFAGQSAASAVTTQSNRLTTMAVGNSRPNLEVSCLPDRDLSSEPSSSEISETQTSVLREFYDGQYGRPRDMQQSTVTAQRERNMVSTASQVGTLLVPTKICMDKVDVDHLAVSVPLTEWRSTEVDVSAILASTVTELTPVITNTSGIQMVEMKDVEMLGLQIGDQVYVADVIPPPPRYVVGTFGPARDFNAGAVTTDKNREVIYIGIPRNQEIGQVSQKAETILNQNPGLRELCSGLQQGSIQPQLSIREEAIGGTNQTIPQFSVPQRATQESAISQSLMRQVGNVSCSACGKKGTLVVGSAVGDRSSITAEFGTRRVLDQSAVSLDPNSQVMNAACISCGATGPLVVHDESLAEADQAHSRPQRVLEESEVVRSFTPQLGSVSCSACGKKGSLVAGTIVGDRSISTGVPRRSLDQSAVSLGPDSQIVNASCTTCGATGSLAVQNPPVFETQADSFTRPSRTLEESAISQGPTRQLGNVSCSDCGARGSLVVDSVAGERSISTRKEESLRSFEHSAVSLGQNMVNAACTACGAAGSLVLQTVPRTETHVATDDQDFYHVSCEATIKPTMISKRLTANLRLYSSDFGCQFDSLPDVELVRGTARQQSEYTVATMSTQQKEIVHASTQCAPIIDAPSTERHVETAYGANSVSPQRQTQSVESRFQHNIETLRANCPNKLMLAEEAATIADSEPVEIRIRRRSMSDLFESSQSTSFSRESSFRRSFFTRDSSRHSTGSVEYLGSQGTKVNSASGHKEHTSGEITTSIRTSTSSLLGTEAVANLRAKEIGEAYSHICRTEENLGSVDEPWERQSLYQALKDNRIIQTVIADYEKDKHGVDGKFFTQAQEIAEVVATSERQIGSQCSLFPSLAHNQLAVKIGESYKTYQRTWSRDACEQTDIYASNAPEVAEVVNAMERAETYHSYGMSLYSEVRSNPIIQRMIQEYEVERNARVSLSPTLGGTMAQAEILSTASERTRVISIDGQLAKMEVRQFTSTDPMTQDTSVPIIRRGSSRTAGSREKPISSSVSSDEGEDVDFSWRQRSTIQPDSTRFDVICSALITPETWDKKVQVDLTSQR